MKPTSSGRLGVDLKFGHARQLIKELIDDWEAWWRTNAFATYEVDDPESGDLVGRVRIRNHPRVEWSLPVGDAVHNARTALDHLAYALVERNGGNTDRAAFPIASRESKYHDAENKGLEGASQADRDAIRALRPWQGGDDQLWRLHRLDIIDKHHLMIPVTARKHGDRVGTTFHVPGAGSIYMGMDVPWAEPVYPLRDGDELYRISKADRTPDDAKVQRDFAYELVFGEGELFEGDPIIETLRDLVDHAADVVEPIVATLA